MGIIENGTISGNLPSKEAFVVHYPGYPSSISRAVETLGGIQGITTARESTSNKLELHFRPEDPSAHPAYGERRHCNGFLLKISKEDVKKDSLPESQPVISTSDACLPEVRPALCADIVARVSESYCFDGMVDYQHVIPIHADIAQQKKRKWMEVKSLAGKNDLMDMADEDVMMLLPQFFSPKDRPDNLVLRLPVTSSPKKKDEELTQNLYEIDIGPVFAIDFSVKEIPKILKWEDYIVPTSNQWKWQVAVSALFEERPVWTRDSIVQRLLDKGLTCTHHMLNRFLLRAAYYFSGGPFLRFWIKRGYDPRKDPESRVFQRMEFRVPPELKGYCDSNATNKSKPSWDDICAFKVFPFKCQTFLQLFELDDEYIQQEIRKPPKQTTCNYKTGWFSEALLDNLRLRVAVRFVSVFPEPGFEDVFKSIQEEFERSEKTRIQKDALQPSQRNHQETTKDMKKCKNTNKEKDDDVNADEDSEDLDDEYEEAANDDDISISSHGYGDMENNSRTYLQGLFNRFPSSASALYGSANDDNDSDGEYPIYEQESNALDDDEEDDE
ncbi:Transcription factor IIIC, subunit 5 [Arabidopsis thaliana]|uniref:Transcription factor IIIC, subunit 5 n=1 Tax=Arabidopsis thaliana TaxID=3702 RepID=F4KH50_ARATH|nr:Transcription factor IIIC, subunit 5 [Arabidopsis thaliana]AED93312.1 Transcription factor IIIC, subunit 5 [Arabidopsis thaliana]|eukprot:NP_197833.2 Transcription factor IIIC, subunit 5 [Arabidopsis thaliana]